MGLQSDAVAGAVNEIFPKTSLLDHLSGSAINLVCLGAGQGGGPAGLIGLEHMGMDPVLDASVRPRLADWLSRSRALPSYATAVEAWAPPDVVEMMRRNGKVAWPEVEPLTRGGRE